MGGAAGVCGLVCRSLLGTTPSQATGNYSGMALVRQAGLFPGIAFLCRVGASGAAGNLGLDFLGDGLEELLDGLVHLLGLFRRGKMPSVGEL